ncbi:hypothetical protein ACKWTF_016050 [Chironomus riparius]
MFKTSSISIICLALLSSFMQALQIPAGQSNSYFDVQLDHVEQIYADKKYTDWSGVKIKKINKTRSMFGEVVFYQALGNEIMIQGNGYMKQGGEYKQMPYRVPKTPLCQFFDDDVYVYPKLAEKSDFPSDVKANCPLKEGTYKIDGFFLDLDKLPKVIAPSGDYASELTWYKDDVLIFHFRLYGTIVNV